MTRKDVRMIEPLINELEKMQKDKKLHNRENIESLKKQIQISSNKDRGYICYILDGTIWYGITLEEAVSLLKRLQNISSLL